MFESIVGKKMKILGKSAINKKSGYGLKGEEQNGVHMYYEWMKTGW